MEVCVVRVCVWGGTYGDGRRHNANSLLRRCFIARLNLQKHDRFVVVHFLLQVQRILCDPYGRDVEAFRRFGADKVQLYRRLHV